MTLEGIVVNGSIVVEEGTSLPEGAKVLIDFVEAFPADHPFAPYDRETELAILRDSIEDMEAGRGSDAREFLNQLALERGHRFDMLLRTD